MQALQPCQAGRAAPARRSCCQGRRLRLAVHARRTVSSRKPEQRTESKPRSPAPQGGGGGGPPRKKKPKPFFLADGTLLLGDLVMIAATEVRMHCAAGGRAGGGAAGHRATRARGAGGAAAHTAGAANHTAAGVQPLLACNSCWRACTRTGVERADPLRIPPHPHRWVGSVRLRRALPEGQLRAAASGHAAWESHACRRVAGVLGRDGGGAGRLPGRGAGLGQLVRQQEQGGSGRVAAAAGWQCLPRVAPGAALHPCPGD